MIPDGTSFGPYRIVGPLGAGGMGEVFRAHDARLRRDVAIKILPLERVGDRDAMSRMVRESRLVASLAHPAIVTIHDVGEADGRFFLVTELIDGETLRGRLRRGPMPVRDALDYGIAIASALAAAHAKGVVHRDIKPDNVMVTFAGAVKVLDFGIAKSVAATDAATVAAATVITEGGVVGTPAYMAPEQLEGRTVDHRADQFGFGVLLFEMLAGARPFPGTTAAEISAAILRDEPAHLSAIRADVPAPLARVVARCLSKNPDARFASTTDLAHALEDIRADFAVLTPATAAPAPGSRRGWWAGAAALLAAAAVAGAWIAWPRTNAAPVPASTPGISAAVVLPFTTIGDVDAYLADGLTEAVTRELGHVKGARVIAASSAFEYRGRTDGVSQIGRELGADVVVRGSVQRAGDRLRIGAALVDARDNSTLWSNQYDRISRDVLAVQDDIAWQVASRLAEILGVAAPPRPADTPDTTPEAYDAYLRGVSVLKGASRGYPEAISELERAVSLDPNFALARARLASAYTQHFFYTSTEPALEQKAFVEIQRALAINPDLAEAYLARAQLVWNLRNGFPHERAIADARRAIENNPSLAEAHIELAKFYYHIGLNERAIASSQEALRLDPRSLLALNRLIGAMIDEGMSTQVSEDLQRNPKWNIRARSTSLAFLGRDDEAIAVLAPRGVAAEELKKIEMNNLALLAQVLARQKRREDAQRALVVAIPLAANPTGLSDTHHAQFAIGCAFASLGDLDKAIEWVTKAATEGYPSYPRFSNEPDLRPLRGSPAFDALLDRLRRDHEKWMKTL